MQTILWGQPTGKVGVLPDPCGRDTLHKSEVYLIGVGTRSAPTLKGFFVIKNELRYWDKFYNLILRLELYLTSYFFMILFRHHDSGHQYIHL
jgi:hypothetical protein